MSVYLLHFLPAYRHAAHYLGYADDVAPRLHAHQHGQGARLTQVARNAGITMLLVCVWEQGDRALERKLKRWHGSGRFCPICCGLPVQMPLMAWMPAYIPEDEQATRAQPDATRADAKPEYTADFEALAEADDLADDILDRQFWAQGQW